MVTTKRATKQNKTIKSVNKTKVPSQDRLNLLNGDTNTNSKIVKICDIIVDKIYATVNGLDCSFCEPISAKLWDEEAPVIETLYKLASIMVKMNGTKLQTHDEHPLTTEDIESAMEYCKNYITKLPK